MSALKGFNLMYASKGRAFIQDAGMGLFEFKGNDRKLIEGTEKSQLHITGVYKIENKKLKLVHLEGGAWLFRKHPKMNDIMYVGFYSGIAVFKKTNGNWIFQKKWDGYGESSRFIKFDKFGQIWVAHPTKGYYRLRLSSDGIDLKEYEFYGTTNKYVDTYAYICKIDGDLVFYNPLGFFNYDSIENSFIPIKYAISLFKDINSIYQYKKALS